MQISSEQANSFTRTKTLSLGKRGIYEECYSENCDFEEVQETYGLTRKGVGLIRDIKHDVKPDGKRLPSVIDHLFTRLKIFVFADKKLRTLIYVSLNRTSSKVFQASLVQRVTIHI